MLIRRAHDAAPFWRLAFGLDDFRKDKTGRRSSEGRRLETERGPLLGPNHRQIHETLDAEPARQTSLDRRHDNGRGNESKRKGHADRAFALALAGGEGFYGPIGVSRELVKPAMGVAEGLQECNSQGVVSLECHSVAEIGFGLRIFRDGGSRLIFNVGAERMLGYTAGEVMNKVTPADISDPQELIARAKALSVELATPITPGFEALVFKASRGIEDIYELTYIRKDGSRFPAVVWSRRCATRRT